MRRALEFCLSQMTPRPHEQVAAVCLTYDGRVVSGALRPGFRSAVRTPDGPHLHESDCVLLLTDTGS